MRFLSVNLDHIATLRQARGTDYPSVVTAAGICELAGADGITLHLREDRRHIQDDDVRLVSQTRLLPLTLEMAATDEMLDIAIRYKPDTVTLVPENRLEVTTEGGIDVIRSKHIIEPVIEALHKAGIKTCLFLEPDTDQIDAAAGLQVEKVELHTGSYADAGFDSQHDQLAKIKAAVKHGVTKGIQMNAGHGLHYQNIAAIAAIADLHEFSIGHSIISRSVFSGLASAVREMANLVKQTNRS